MSKSHTYTDLRLSFDSPCTTNRTFLIITWAPCCHFEKKCVPDYLSIGSLLPKTDGITSIANKRRKYIWYKHKCLVMLCNIQSAIGNTYNQAALLIEMLNFYINCLFFLVIEYCTSTGYLYQYLQYGSSMTRQWLVWGLHFKWDHQ